MMSDDRILGEVLDRRLETFAAEQAELESLCAALQGSAAVEEALGSTIALGVRSLAESMVALAGDDPAAWAGAGEALRRHPAHRRFLMQSALLRQALRTPGGCGGGCGADLLLMLCRDEPAGPTLYARLLDAAFRESPAADAVRARVSGMERILCLLPTGSRVLCLGSGPAWEVRGLARSRARGALGIDLADHDPRALASTMAVIDDPAVRHVAVNPRNVIRGRTAFTAADRGGEPFELRAEAYDLIYALGVCDGVPDVPANPARGASGLTGRLFELLKPGGRLLVGNLLVPGAGNPFSLTHRFMLEGFADLKPIYRSLDEIGRFAANIPPQRHRARLLDQTLHAAAGPASMIGVLDLQRID